ncbi:nucleotidyltransferase [Bacillus sp. 31A1R]|uniref:tRNA(Met) cytidine acetate ligase n=1 Tax=Robertmurraya mangrovi TaxID=3098077 RepID=A0ABU5IU56_9BACI|nr:nucleotidyltransferase [Bacillus sp. 31A1R]MDZ5470680.1 nucleotidyltransferase [Bacillus sp. 31A1R]
MRAVGVIVEYNPFHNGHAFHLERTIEEGEADVVIAAMSGQFLQRGEPALLPKWNRAHMALKAGVDLVFELPYQFATQKAETFAKGAVSILASAGCESLCFGSESGDIYDFHQTIQFLDDSHDLYQEKIKYYMNEGYSYPKATSTAFKDLSPSKEILDLSKPNNILGFHYIKAIRELNVPMKALTITRKNADYHDEHFASETIASATSIRKALFSDGGDIETVSQYVPQTTYDLLNDYYIHFKQFHQWEHYWSLLQYRILHSSPEELKEIYEVEEGIENRLLTVALQSNSFKDFMTKLKTKRYTWTRLQRMCVHILTNTKKEDMKKRMCKATYLRLLGMTEKGRIYLNQRKKDIEIPIVSKLGSFDSPDIHLDIKASKIYALGGIKVYQQNLINMEYNQPPIYIRK